MVASPLIFVLIISAIVYFVSIYSGDNQQSELAMVGASEQLQTRIDDTTDYNLTFDMSESEAQEALANGDIDGYFKVNENDNPLSAKFYKQNDSSDVSLNSLTQALENYRLENTALQIGLTNEQLQSLTQESIDIETITLSEENDGTFVENVENEMERVLSMGAAYLITIVILLFASIYTALIAQEIANEKGSRIMEIILSSISASTHFFGKLIGISAMIFTQFLIYFIIFGIFSIVIRQIFADQIALALELINAMDISLLEILGPLLVSSFAYLLIGLFTYICLAAFFGSLVSRSEDVQTAIGPVVILVVIGFYIGIFSMASPNNIIVKIGALIPFFTPLVMPFRLAMGVAGQGEIILSFIIPIATMIAILFISANLYKSNVLIYSDNNIWSNLLQSIRLRKNVK